MFKHYLSLVLKGTGMGAANVIPGVSGGTVALITGIFEELIDSLKSLDLAAVKLLFTGKFKAFANHINLAFLAAVFFGVSISILSLARIFEYLFTFYPVYIWAYFFGLILASIYFVGRTISHWNLKVIIAFLLGAGIALSISFLNPATENDNFIYLIVCGAVAVCSMILPGISGSFVLILMGNYQLIVIESINNMRLDILFPVAIGAVFGLIAFSHLLSWVFKKYRDATISSLTGFIFGSLAIIWPWKNSYDSASALMPVNKVGAFIDHAGNVVLDTKVYSYQLSSPGEINATFLVALLLIIAGIITIWFMEKFAGNTEANK
ncbi:MAG: DUF368 domain-containing protein [Bacteroidota bacterium]|nr:MAG: DUF368 domain-containing protein [Bacteroidota bacterium]